MSAVDQAGEVRRLAAQNLSQREIAEQLGITRYQVRRVLGRPAPAQPPTAAHDTARPAARATPTGEDIARAGAQPPKVAEPVGAVGDRAPRATAQERPVTEGVVVAAAPVGHVTGAVRFPRPDTRSPWLRVDLSRRRGLLGDLVALTRVGLRIPYVVEDVLRAFAAAYHQALSAGRLQRGQGYEVQITVRPCRHV
ncbi:hypothetical protein ACKI1J_15725 [Streptomyces scabiei]|uniref:hypothetical protein n=1 Tax=Streptomyces scabiei TaxID=1930 RepID=UPI0038F74B15